MILDQQLQFDPAATAITVTAARPTSSTCSNARDLAIGDAFESPELVLTVTTTFTAAGGATLRIQFQGSTDNITFTTYCQTDDIPKANLTAGTVIKLRISPQPPHAAGLPRYLRAELHRHDGAVHRREAGVRPRAGQRSRTTTRRRTRRASRSRTDRPPVRARERLGFPPIPGDTKMKRLTHLILAAALAAVSIGAQAQMVNRITGPSILDQAGASQVNTEGQKASYFASLGSNTPAATPTDVAILTGSATKTIKVTRVTITVQATASGAVVYDLVKRSGGTQSAVNTAFAAGTHAGRWTRATPLRP
jgi:hypothetical protein